jgi:hypothetical protein
MVLRAAGAPSFVGAFSLPYAGDRLVGVGNSTLFIAAHTDQGETRLQLGDIPESIRAACRVRGYGPDESSDASGSAGAR